MCKSKDIRVYFLWYIILILTKYKSNDPEIFLSTGSVQLGQIYATVHVWITLMI